MNQNIKIDNRTQKSSKDTNLTIIIANTKYTANSVPTQNVKAGNNIVQYKPIGKFSHDERTLLNQSLRDGYVYINEAYTLLKKAKADTLEKVEAILGELEESTLEALLANIQQIQDKILNPKLVVLKENYLDTEKDHILASVKEDDTYTFTVYDNFFDKKEFSDNRAGVIIHEIAHLCDIAEGADMYDINSAECLKNIILHLNDILSLDTIQAEYAKKQEPQERYDDTLTYDPDQPRVPAGSSEGGQWTSGGSSSSSKDKEAKASKSKDADNPEEEESQADNSQSKEYAENIAKEQAKVFDALKEETRSFLKNEGLSEEDINEKLEDITLEGMTAIFEEYFEAKFGNFKDIIESSDSDIPLLASNGSYSGLMPSRSTASKKSSSGAVSIKDDKYSSAELVPEYKNETKLGFYFTSSDKENPQNSKDFDIKNRDYKDDPAEGFNINRSYSKTGETGCWISGTVKYDGFEANKQYTILLRAKYSYIDKKGEKQYEEVSVLYDTISDNDGCIILERINLLNYNSNLEKSFGDMDIELESLLLDGSVEENTYGNTEYIEEKDIDKDNNPNRDKTMFSYSLAQHARIPSFDYNKNINPQNNGGAIDGEYFINDKIPTPIFKLKMNVKDVK